MNDAAQSFPKLARMAGSAPVASETETQMVVLPDPVGYYMLIALPTMAQMTAKGIIIPDEVNARERAATVVGTVLAMGPECYNDIKKFAAGPWCKVGDQVIFSRYSGLRFKSRDTESTDLVEYRMLTDDGIMGTVPEGAQVGGL